jgi:hypothetical protein
MPKSTARVCVACEVNYRCVMGFIAARYQVRHSLKSNELVSPLAVETSRCNKLLRMLNLLLLATVAC